MFDWTSLIALLSAVAAAWAAHESRRSANAARAAVEAQTLKAFLDEYGQPAMSDALRDLVRWRQARGDSFAERWLEQLKAQDTEAAAVDRARRHVKAFFHKAVRMYAGGFVSAGVLRHALDVQGLNAYLDIVCPLEDALNPGRDHTVAETLRAVVGRDARRRPLA